VVSGQWGGVIRVRVRGDQGEGEGVIRVRVKGLSGLGLGGCLEQPRLLGVRRLPPLEVRGGGEQR
jgi:hypothetical protein